jgi:hypothetical protein
VRRWWLPGILLFPLPVSLFPQAPAAGSDYAVTLLTYESGGAVWERFGHNAIRVRNLGTGAEAHYDYGRFDFSEKNFFLKFARGEMWYSMGYDADPEKYIRAYAGQGRKIWAQELDLTPAQARALVEFLEWNIRPENARYAYDYYLDNCSTRIRDALDRVLNGAIGRYGIQASGMTWREETRRLNQHNPALYTGLLLALGQPVDLEMSRWEQMFLPIRLREHADSVLVTDSAGVTRKLVKSSRVLFEGGRWPVPPVPANWAWRYLLLGVAIGGTLFWLGKGRGRGARAAFLGLATLWALLAGMAGLVISWLSLFSAHRAAHQNENLLAWNLLALALAIVLPGAARGSARLERPARRLALVVAALAAVGLLVKAVPGFTQDNLALTLLALPAHAGLWLGLRSRESS